MMTSPQQPGRRASSLQSLMQRSSVPGNVISAVIISLLSLFVLLSFSSQVYAAKPQPAETGGESKIDQLLVYVGTYTEKNSKGIYRFRLDLATGTTSKVELAAETVQPSFLAIGPRRRFLFAVNETREFEGLKSGAVSAFSIDPETKNLTFLNQQPSGGEAPCHLVVDNAGKYVLVANYWSGNFSVFPIAGDGRLGKASDFIQHKGSGKDPQRQDGPHAHGINLDAANRFAFATDLGLDQVVIYQFDATKGKLISHQHPPGSVPPGAGPRHFAFHPSGRYAFVINELDSTVCAFAYDARRGVLKRLQTLSTLPAGFTGHNTTAELQLSPSGKFLYGSNRGHDSIVVFAIDADSGKLTYVEHESTQGKEPRNFGIDPTGTYLLAANQHSDTIVMFRIDPQTGKLSPTGNIIDVPTPICVMMMPIDH